MGLRGLHCFLPTVIAESQHCGESVNPEDFNDFMKTGIQPKRTWLLLESNIEITNDFKCQRSI